MILDSSAVVAVSMREPEHEELASLMAGANSLGIGTPTLTETSIVLSARLGLDPQGMLDRFLRNFQVSCITFREEHWRVSIDAYRRFGKGRHPAALNFGDCLSYAVAKLARRPLLYVGDDFAKTDLEPARRLP